MLLDPSRIRSTCKSRQTCSLCAEPHETVTVPPTTQCKLCHLSPAQYTSIPPRVSASIRPPVYSLHNWRSGPQSTLCTPGVVLLKPKSGQNPSLIKTLQSPCNDYKVLHSLASLSPLTFFTTHSPFTLYSPASWPLADHESSFASVSWIPAELALWWLS